MNLMDHFSEHRLHILQENEVANIYEFKNGDSLDYKLLVTLVQNQLYISGDLGDWIFNLTWNSKVLLQLPTGDIGYFIGKLSSKCKKYVWDPKKCIEFLGGVKESLLECRDEWTQDEIERVNEIFYEIKTDSEVEYTTSVWEAIDYLEDELELSDLWELFGYEGRIDPQLSAAIAGIGEMQKEYRIMKGIY